MVADSGKVLIIDDDADFLEAVKTCLSSQGHEVLTASTGAEGVSSALRERPDVIVVDLLMAPEDGVAICEKLRAQPETHGAAILVVSAVHLKLHKSVKSPEIGARLDADGYLDKPVKPEELMKTVRDMLHLARSRAAMTGGEQ